MTGFKGNLGLALWLFSFVFSLESVALAANASLAGTIKDEAAKPMRAAVVTASLGKMSISRYSDASGRYEFADLKPGTYRVSATAWGYGVVSAEKQIASAPAELNFDLRPKWSVMQISTAEYISAYGDDKDIRNIEATCTACHNFSWIMRRRGMTADEWQDFIPRMGTAFVTPRLSPEKLKDISTSLEKYFGPGSPVPTREQVKHVPVSDEALRATFRTFAAPTRNFAHSVHVGPDGKAWFTEFDNYANRVASFDLASEEFHEYEIPTPRATPHNPWVAHDGKVWISEEAAKKLAVLDPATGRITEYPVPGGAGTHTLREDSAGNIWSSGFEKAVRFDPKTGEFSTYAAPGYDIAVDSQNNGWTGDGPGGAIWRIDGKTGAIKKYPVAGATFIRGIEVDGQDNVWFGDVMGHRLGRIDHKTGKMTFYHPPTSNFSPYGIVIDKISGKMWLADYLGANVTRFDPATGKFTEYPFPSRTQMIRFFATDKQGRVWYTDFTNGRIGVMDTGETTVTAHR